IVSYMGHFQSEDTGDGGWRVAAFTANFGNGITSTVSLEEPRRTSILNTSIAGQVTGSAVPTVFTTATGGLQTAIAFNNPFLVGAPTPIANQDYANMRNPDIVWNWRYDQTWGALMIGGAVHDASAGYYAANSGTQLTCAVPGDVATVNALTLNGLGGNVVG